MEPKLCQNVYIVRTTLHSDPEAQLITFLQKIGMNVIVGERPIEYLVQLIANQSIVSTDSSELIKSLPDGSVTSEQTSDCSDASRINDSIATLPNTTVSTCNNVAAATTTSPTTSEVIPNHSSQPTPSAVTLLVNANCVTKTVVTQTTSVISSSAPVDCAATLSQNGVHKSLSDPMLVIAPSHPSTRCAGNTLFVLGDFRGQLFRQLLQQTQCVIGFTALLYYFREKIVSSCPHDFNPSSSAGHLQNNW
jgi:hypothetical protein